MHRTPFAFVMVLLFAGLAVAAPKNAELIVGKWDLGMMTTMEYRKDNTFAMSIGSAVISGKYKFVKDDVIEVEISLGDKIKKNQLKVDIKGDEMTTTDPEGKMNKMTRVK